MQPDRLRLFLAIALLAGFPLSGALAAPTCQNRDGETVRCGTSAAMPVGWTATATPGGQSALGSPPPATLPQLFELVSSLGIFFALLALMPDFDGTHPGEWDGEERERPGP